MSTIISVWKHGLDSRGNPTVEVEVVTDTGALVAAVPSGAVQENMGTTKNYEMEGFLDR